MPAPTIRTVRAAVEGCDEFGPRLREESDRLGVTALPDVTVLADGAEWIWNVAADHWPRAAGVLDVYHALEHVSDAVKGVFGDATEATNAQAQVGAGGFWGTGRPGWSGGSPGCWRRCPKAVRPTR